MASTTAPSRQRSVQPSLRIWLQWVLANALGFGIGFPLCVMMLAQNERIADARLSALVGVFGWTLAGLSVGIMQWAALRPVLSGTRWAFATAIGWASGLAITAVFSLASMPVLLPHLGMPGLALAYGTGAGVFQALVLRFSVRHAVIWIAASVAGWLSGWVLWMPLQLFFTVVQEDMGVFASVFAMGAIIGTVSGVVTGLALVCLLRLSEQAAGGPLA